MEYTAIQKNIGHSPRKLRLVADMVRKMTPKQALMTLEFTNRAAAEDMAKAIKTALANGGNLPTLGFKTIEINEGSKMKRYRVGTAGRGRGRPYKKKLSHIKIVLSDEVVEKIKKPKTKIVEEKKQMKTVEKEDKEIKREEVMPVETLEEVKS